ncbi:MAG: nucleotidyl transferase AbiEii/AbiGii toxin family protein [Bacteroidota bacterium]
MISFDEIKTFFADSIRRNPSWFEYMLKEYFHYRMLDIIFSSEHASKLSFIGGTSLRILHHIQRFSEDLDFDCFNLSREEFILLTDKLIDRLRQEGIEVEAEDKGKDLRLTAFRRNIIFPGLLFELGLTGHREKKLLIKIECEPHNYNYEPDKPIIQKFNVFTQIFTPSPEILLSMKTGAVLERGKGRDYYDFIFLSGLASPDFGYLKSRFGIKNEMQLYERILKTCKDTDFQKKSRDFEKLVFDQAETKKVLFFIEYIRQKLDQSLGAKTGITDQISPG